MRLTKILIYFIIFYQPLGGSAASSEINKNITAAVKNGTTPIFWSMYLIKKENETLDQSNEDSKSLVVGFLLQKIEMESISIIKSVNLNSSVIIDSCKLRIGLQPEDRYDLFCSTPLTQPRAAIELALTPLQATCLTGDLVAMKLLIKAGANINGSPDELSPITSCLATKKIKQVEFLIDQGADVKVLNSPYSLLTLLSMVSVDASDQADAAILAEKIIAKGADPHYFKSRRRDFSEIEMATQLGNLAVLKVLFKHGADINKITSEGLTPLALAERNRNFAIANFLKSKGAKR